ncbi:low molecular weight protein-tyrosine-phosphatase [Shewanella sp. UCD-KL12]|uniref:low molecular weight protein-tyrosine-phosphatase n=1 Tax=Shewanella sp. UCD-KL12 TaxID=1917163 RepID=UPI0009714C76|nr:low molecular weight protein-tyrosine-phosphatase [Shewanella sp. UCD-KL12]
MKPINSVLFVCMGNICRSPTGEAVFRQKAGDAGLSIEVDSAGTIAHHQGEQADPRSRAAGEQRGYSFKGQTARQVTDADFVHFDLILAADSANLSDLQAACPEEFQHKLKLMLSFIGADENKEVPDPYYGAGNGFELVLDLIEESCDNLINKIKVNE